MTRSRKRPERPQVKHPPLSASRIEEMIQEAIVDAYTESEQAGGFYAMLEQELDLPFDTSVLGAPVSVRRLDITEAGEIVAVCYRGRERQAVSILTLPLPTPPPAGWEWIEAYRRWARAR